MGRRRRYIMAKASSRTWPLATPLASYGCVLTQTSVSVSLALRRIHLCAHLHVLRLRVHGKTHARPRAVRLLM